MIAPLVFCRVASGEEWPIYGARAMGMGGAGIAAARGGASVYWNPASLARTATRRAPSVEDENDASSSEDASPKGKRRLNGNLSLNATAMLAAPGGTFEAVDQLSRDVRALNISTVRTKLNTGQQLTETELRLALKILGEDIPALNESEGLLFSAVGGPSAQLWRFGLAFIGTVHGGASVSADLNLLSLGNQGFTSAIGSGQDRSGQLSSSGQSLADQLATGGGVTQNQAEELVFQSESAGLSSADSGVQNSLQSLVAATAANTGGSSSNSFTENGTTVDVRGIFLQEIALAYAQPIGERLSVGVSAKAMHAWTYTRQFTLDELRKSKDLLKDVRKIDDEDSETAFGVDVGALLSPFPMLDLGLTAKNINSPRFGRQFGEDYVLDPNLRAGVALYPLSWLTLAADIDCWKNHSEVLPAHRSQVVGGGAQFDLSVIALRAGISKNLLDEREDFILHAGLALRIWHFSLEAAAMLTPSLRGFEFNSAGTIPERTGVSITAGFNIAF